ncbi:MAG: hypothetical protein ABIN94_07590 [Ferruginibacter sp.]
MIKYTLSVYLRVILIFLLICGMQVPTVFSQAPVINKVEYYLDVDPGYGNATNLSFAGTNNVTATINLNIAPLIAGTHLVGIRSRDVNGAWSMDNKWIFLKPYSNTGAVLQPNINRVEWFLDNDPGYGKATALSIAPGQNLPGVAININLLPLVQGVHIVGVRSMDANGAWSIDNKWIFLKPYQNTGAVVQPNITRVEWFLDTDPGYGSATPISISAAQNLSGLAITIALATINQGVHVVGVRSLDANGVWSLDNKWIFLKPYPNTGATPQPNITRVEWFMDIDPGYGNATPITIVPGQNLAGITATIDLLLLKQGVHVVGVRSQDANGAWSLDNKWIFLKPFVNGAVATPQIVQAEYFIDSDPGYGKGTPITITAATDVSNIIFDADISVVANGAHKLGIRSMDANGAWSIDNKVDFTGGTFTGSLYTWVGNVSTSWTDPANWSSGKVPSSIIDIIIPANRPFYPVVANGINANCQSIILQPGAAVTVATGGHLIVNH